MKKRWSLLLLTLIICLTAMLQTACGLFGKNGDNQPQTVQAEQTQIPGPAQSDDTGPKYSMAVILPDESEHKWARSGRYITETLVEYGYEAELLYADNDAEKQAALINEVVARQADCIIVAAVDSYSDSIRQAVENANENDVRVVAYDRLIMDTEAVDIYIAFDPYLSGRMLGQFLESALSLDGSKNIEILMGTEADSSQSYFYSGAMDVLMPHIDNGRIKVLSGHTSYVETSVGEPFRQKSHNEMEAILSNYYLEGQRVDAVLASDDSIALGAIGALESAGYGQDGFPIVVGVGCHNENMLQLIKGRQRLSLFADERIAAEKTVEAADQLVHGVTPSGTDVLTFNNGKKTVPALLIEPVPVDSENYKTLLIGGGYYSYTDLNPE